MEKVIVEVEVQTGKANKATEGVKDGINDAKASATSFGATIDKVTGGMYSAFMNGLKGIKATILGFKTLRGAIAATGLGALVLVLTSLTSYFTKTQRGADLMAQAMAGVKAAVAVLVDAASMLGETLVGVFRNPRQALEDFGNSLKQFVIGRFELLMQSVSGFGDAMRLLFEGKFKDAAKAAGTAFVDLQRSVNPAAMVIEGLVKVGGELAEQAQTIAKDIRVEARAAMELEKAMQAVERREIQMITTRARRRQQIEELRLLAADENNSLEKRAEALAQAMELERQLADEQVSIAAERARIITEQNALGESTNDDLRAQAEAEALVIELQAQRDTRLKELVATYNALKKQITATTAATKEDTAAAAEAAKYYEDLAKQYDAVLELQNSAQDQEINAVRDKYNVLLNEAEQYGFDRAVIEEQQESEINAIREKYAKEDRARDAALNAAKLQMASQVLTDIASVVNGFAQGNEERERKAFAITKRIQQAQAVISALQGANNIFASAAANPSSVLFPAQPFIMAATALASGLANARAIGQQQYMGGTPSAGNIARPQIQAGPSVSTIGNTPQGQIADAIKQTPQRAYVIASDVNSGQALERKIIANAQFG